MSAKKSILIAFISGCIITITCLLITVIIRFVTGGFIHDTLLYYLVLGLGSVLPTLIFINSDHISQKKMWLRFFLHFILTLVVVLGIQFYFAWRYPENWSFYLPYTQVLLPFVIIYVISMLIFLRSQQALAKQFNQRIQERKLNQLEGIEQRTEELRSYSRLSNRKDFDFDLGEMNLKKRLLILFALACIISTMRILSVLLTHLLFNFPIHHDALFYYTALGFGSALPILIFIGSDNRSQKNLQILSMLHFVLTTVIICGVHIFFNWHYAISDQSFYNLAGLLIGYLIIYFNVILIFRRHQEKLAKQFNERIRKR